jgi:hypothetical protein
MAFGSSLNTGLRLKNTSTVAGIPYASGFVLSTLAVTSEPGTK